MWRWLAIVWLVTVTSAVSAQEKLTGWHSDLESARKVAKETGKPLFVVFRCVR